jgi:Ca2+-binding RTX toxin-like protein
MVGGADGDALHGHNGNDLIGGQDGDDFIDGGFGRTRCSATAGTIT